MVDVADPGDAVSPFGPGTRLLGTDDLAIPPRVLREMAFIYDVTELATAVKPALLARLLAEHDAPVTYLDPDIVVYGPLDEAAERATRTPIVLTPHVLEPIPRDGFRIRDEDLLLCGQFNLGFITVGAGAEPFLAWWGERTRAHACNEPAQGMFTDQRWIDFVPALFDHDVVRHRGWNVAYWNLHERPLRRDEDGRVTAGGEPLVFLHLSGFDPDADHLLSRHTLDTPRVLLSDEPVLAELAEDYAERLRAIDPDGPAAYGYGLLAGRTIPLEIRRLFRQALLDPDPADGPLPEPFGDAGDGPVLRWLNQRVVAHPEGYVTRLERMVWQMRVDLQLAFPDLQGAGGAGLSAWCRQDGWYDERYGHLLVDVSEPDVAPPHPLPGLNIIGYVRAELGVGEAARLVVRAAEAGGVPHVVHAYGATRSRQLDPSTPHAGDGLHDPDVAFPYLVNVACVNADATPRLVADLPAGAVDGRRRVGVWFWELETLPDAYHGAFAHVDEVWVASEFVAGAVAPHAPCPVRVMPLPILEPPRTWLTRADLGLPEDAFVFGFHFDALSVPGRKNPDGVLEAYLRAFGPDDGTHLVLKVINGDAARPALERLRKRAADRPDVQIVDRYLSRVRMVALTHHTDAYVSLHRSEGYGLTLAQAMAAGTPVIATGYSGNLAFMDAENSLLVPYELVPVGEGNAPYPADARWAEPDVDAASRAMRTLVDEPEVARRLGEAGRRSVLELGAPDRVGAWLCDRVDELSATVPGRR